MLKTESPRGYRTSGGLVVLGLLVQIPFLDRGLSFLDEGSILAIADGLRQGERLYADRVTPLAPLTYELMAALLELFGPHILVGRLLQALVFAGCLLLIHRILFVFVDARWALWGALAVLVVKPLGFPLWTIVNYSQLALLFCLAAVLSALCFFPSHRQPWLLAAGAAVGMALVSKQNLGALAGVTVAIGLLLDWIDGRERQPHALVERLGAFAAAAAVPVLAVVGTFTWQGSFGALVNRTILGLAALSDPYHIPLPGLGIWASRTDELGIISFAYFPAPVVQLAWQGGLNLYSRTTFLFVESAVKAAYFLPLAALAGSLVAIWRRPLVTAKSSRCQELLVFVFAAACYASMLYRADWVHLMNVYPALLLPCVVVLANWCAGSRWRERLAAGAGAVWLAAGVAVTVVILTVYRTPVETPRGRLLDAPAAAQNAARVLAYVERQPAEERIGFLRADPLYYFLTGRRVPLRFDLVMPGIVTPADDEEIAARLLRLDQVIYNPKVFPTAPTPIAAYAPQTAEVLAQKFRVDQVLTEDAVVLKPRSSAANRIRGHEPAAAQGPGEELEGESEEVR